MKRRKWRAEILVWSSRTGGAEDAREIIRYCGHRRNPVASFCLRASTCMGPMRVSDGGAIERADKGRGYLVPRTTCYLPVSSSTSPLIRTWLLKGDRTPDFFSPRTDDPLRSAMASRVIRQRYLLNLVYIISWSHNIKKLFFFLMLIPSLTFLLMLTSIHINRLNSI